MADGFYVKQIELGPMANYVYLVGSEKTREVAVVDPAWDIDAIVDIAASEDLRITTILVTHFHGDHTNGVKALLERAPAKLYINKHDAPFVAGLGSAAIKADSGDTIAIGDVSIELLHTPGHTPGSQCFHVRGHVVSGDTMFIGACGRCDGPGSSPEQMFDSLHSLASLPGSTVLLPGHNYALPKTSTIAEEAAGNPFLRMDLQRFLGVVPGPGTRG
jgi:hydroxyacylglutathione hydrolase